MTPRLFCKGRVPAGLAPTGTCLLHTQHGQAAHLTALGQGTLQPCACYPGAWASLVVRDQGQLCCPGLEKEPSACF